jgi:hypothetical protein
MSTLFVFLAFFACIATGFVGAFGMRFYIERNRIIAEREDPRDTKIRDLQATVKLTNKDLALTRTNATDMSEHLKFAHIRIDELLEQRSMLREKFNTCENLLKNEIGERELLQDKLSVAKTQLETMKEQRQELELQLKASSRENMLDPALQTSESESDNLHDDAIDEVFSPDIRDEGSASLIESLTGELDRWKRHCHVLGNELKCRREQISQTSNLTPNQVDAVDELTDIRGIGKVMARKLHKLGIYRFQELIDLDSRDLDRAQELIPDIRRRIHRDCWIDQARALNRGKNRSFV